MSPYLFRQPLLSPRNEAKITKATVNLLVKCGEHIYQRLDPFDCNLIAYI